MNMKHKQTDHFNEEDVLRNIRDYAIELRGKIPGLSFEDALEEQEQIECLLRECAVYPDGFGEEKEVQEPTDSLESDEKDQENKEMQRKKEEVLTVSVLTFHENICLFVDKDQEIGKVVAENERN